MMMKRWIAILGALVIFSGLLGGIDIAHARSFSVKLPYAKGQSFVVVQGYNTLPTHIKKDSYALDFSQDGCQAYGKPVVAAAAGRVMFMSQSGYNGGYGTELIIDHSADIVSRYAHMIPNSITVGQNASIKQGQVVGMVGNTGLVAGAACPAHPGTHLHFAMDIVNGDGTFTAYNPEPISNYAGMTAGKWYLSDNAEDDSEALASIGTVLGASDAATASASVPVNSTTIISIPAAATTTPLAPISAPAALTTTSPDAYINGGIPSGSVSVISAGSSQGAPISSSSGSGSDQIINNSSTPTASSTPTTTLIISSPTPSVAASGTLFAQSDDSASSPRSWYGDNWFDLGNGFAGVLNTLTLEGEVDGEDPFTSSVSLQEFKDPNYTAMIQQFPISDNAPFTSAMTTTTFADLSIPLKPYFYYRLTTNQGRQNLSVVLAGTPSTTTGIVMNDNFYYGTGRVESTSTFFPFMIMEGIEPTSTLTPPPLTTPTNLAVNFDELNMQLNITVSSSTDPDWPGNPLGYEVNHSTSTSLDDAAWGGEWQIPLTIGDSYLIGGRAVDNYGAVSGVVTTTWNFPSGFSPYLLSPPTGYANQYFTVNTTSTLQSIEIYTTNFQTNARNPLAAGCSMMFFFSDGPNSYATYPSDNSYSGPGCAGNPVFSFASSSILLVPGVQYQWIYELQTGNPSTGGSVQFYGTATNTAGGLFNDPSLVNAKFTVTGDDGVLFGN